jgi:hypothetical protein
MYKLPEEATIGLLTYQIVEEPRLVDEQMYGQLVRTKGVIEILPDMPDEMKEVTFWHECIHEMLCQAGEFKSNERIVGALSYAIPRFLRDNPKVK